MRPPGRARSCIRSLDWSAVPAEKCVAILFRVCLRRSRWLSKDHPDPEGFHLEIVAAVSRLYLKEGKSGTGNYYSPLAEAFEKNNLGEPDFAVFCACRRACTPLLLYTSSNALTGCA